MPDLLLRWRRTADSNRGSSELYPRLIWASRAVEWTLESFCNACEKGLWDVCENFGRMKHLKRTTGHWMWVGYSIPSHSFSRVVIIFPDLSRPWEGRPASTDHSRDLSVSHPRLDPRENSRNKVARSPILELWTVQPVRTQTCPETSCHDRLTKCFSRVLQKLSTSCENTGTRFLHVQ